MSAVFGSFLASLKFLGQRYDDDCIDRLHYFLTSNLLLALSVLVSFKQFGGKPIECLVPDMFTSAWEQYAENYCWSQDTYHIPFDETVPLEDEERVNKQISYYQWVPFFLLLVAACFRLPCLFWKCFASHSGIQIHDLLQIARDPMNVKAEARCANIKALTLHLQNALKFQRRLYKRNVTPHKYVRVLNLPYTSNYVTVIYCAVKSLYLGNVLFQLYIMNKFLETTTYTMYGFGALTDILRGVQWDTSGIFPRVTLCDFKVRVMGNNVQPYSVQCVLIINIFNEKIFVFLWFWFMMLAVVTTASLVYWLSIMMLPWNSKWFISRHLELSEMPFDARTSEKDVDRFVSGYLRRDGTFILRMITMHAGIIFATELVVALWRAFYGFEETIKQANSTISLPTLTPSPRSFDDFSEKVPFKEDKETSSGFRLRLPLGLGRRGKNLWSLGRRSQESGDLLTIPENEEYGNSTRFSYGNNKRIARYPKENRDVSFNGSEKADKDSNRQLTLSLPPAYDSYSRQTSPKPTSQTVRFYAGSEVETARGPNDVQ